MFVKQIKLLAIIASIIWAWQISSLSQSLGMYYYVFLALVFVVLILFERELKINKIIFFMVFFALTSIIVNDVPAFFYPYKRFGAFILLLGIVGPLLSNHILVSFRKFLLKTINNIIIVSVVISFGGILIGLPGMLGRGGYCGFFNHSMTLSAVAALSMLISIKKLHVSNNKIGGFLFLLSGIISFLACLVSGSRAALFAGLLGVVGFYLKLYQGRIVHFFKVILSISLVAFVSFPVWRPFADRIYSKMEYGKAEGDLFVTRLNLWEMRLDEFVNSPINGIGFASVDITKTDRFDKVTGVIEPGSSWLVVLSMTGLAGFLPMLLFILRGLAVLTKEVKDSVNAALFIGIILFYIVHMTAEGYVFSAGSGMFFYFWLILGNLKYAGEVRE